MVGLSDALAVGLGDELAVGLGDEPAVEPGDGLAVEPGDGLAVEPGDGLAVVLGAGLGDGNTTVLAAPLQPATATVAHAMTRMPMDRQPTTAEYAASLSVSLENQAWIARAVTGKSDGQI